MESYLDGERAIPVLVEGREDLVHLLPLLLGQRALRLDGRNSL